MAVITTYVCDVSGVSGTNKDDFVGVSIRATTHRADQYSYGGYKEREEVLPFKLIHKDVAIKIGLVKHNHFDSKALEVPEVTFESKLKTLLKNYVADLVQDHLDNQ